MSSLSIVRALCATNSRNEKERIVLEAFFAGEREFFVGVKLANDKLISFGVAKVAEILEDDDSDGDYTFAEFLQLCDDLAKRRLTGHAARDAIHNAAERCHTATWNEFYRRILLKDMKIGLEVKSINKVLKNISSNLPEAANYITPVFSPQLAHDGLKDEHQKYLRGKKYYDLKLDGVRLVTILDKEANTVTQYTREGRVNENFPHITAALAQLLPFIPGSIMLDGEMVAGSYQELMEQLNNKNSKTTNMKLALFDIVPLADFRKGYSSISQKQRHETLVTLVTSNLFIEKVGAMAYVNPKIEVDLDTEEGWESLNAFRRATLLERDAGESVKEGVMVKDMEAGYVNDRSTAWLKLKPLISVSLTVVDLERGKPDGKFANSLGGLVCEGTDDGKQIRVVVGGGITEEERHRWWNDPSQIVGYVVEIEADKLSKSKTSDDIWSLRHPRLKGKRGTVPGEKM